MCDKRDEREDGVKQEDPLGIKKESLWDKISKGVEEGLKAGKDEVVRTAKIGKLRLDIASLKSSKSDKINQLGNRVFGLLKNGQVTIPQVDFLLEEITGLEDQVEAKEEEIRQVLTEKQTREEAPAKGLQKEEPLAVEPEPVLAKKEENLAEQTDKKEKKGSRTTKKKKSSSQADGLKKDDTQFEKEAPTTDSKP